MSNLRILNIENTGNLISESADKSTFTINLPEDLVNMGRCLVEVVSGWVVVSRQSVDANNDVDDLIGKIAPSNTTQIVVRSNIEQVGFSTATGGESRILGVCLLNTTTIPAANVFNGDGAGTGMGGPNAIPFVNSGASHQFLCNRLPTQLIIEKMFYSVANTPVLTHATSYNQTLPMQVVLKLTFLDME